MTHGPSRMLRPPIIFYVKYTQSIGAHQENLSNILTISCYCNFILNAVIVSFSHSDLHQEQGEKNGKTEEETERRHLHWYNLG